MTKLCRNCHSLAKDYRDGDRPIKFSLTQEEQEKGRSNQQEIAPAHCSLNWYMGIWDECPSGSSQDRDESINRTTREEGCCHFSYQPAMFIEAAKELKKRSSGNEQLKRSNSYTRVGLWVAAGALAFSALIEFLEKA